MARDLSPLLVTVIRPVLLESPRYRATGDTLTSPRATKWMKTEKVNATGTTDLK
jgi:hypothetical protein